MQWLEAMTILGLTYSQIQDETAIRQAWKQSLLLFHPDKNRQAKDDATEQTQRLNEAKEVLHKKLSEDKCDNISSMYERNLREREQVEAEAKRRQTEEDLKECEKWAKIRAEARRECYARKRKKRAPGARVHRKIDSYQEGKALVDEMNKFFQERLVSKPWNKILVKDILNNFVTSRNAATKLETNLFKRHNKKLILAIFPDVVYSTRKSQRCFLHLDFRK
jgi:curved DNA-binding protein CbpA